MKQTFPYTRNITNIDDQSLTPLIELALAEDAPQGDVTAEVFTDGQKIVRAHLLAKQDGVFCGLKVFQAVFQAVAAKSGAPLDWTVHKKDGDALAKGDVPLEVRGPAGVLLTAERPALNFIGHMSAVSTLTARIVGTIRAEEMEFYDTDEEGIEKPIAVLDTRKTLPGFRRLAKYAVHCGGGTNHRLNLSEMGMIKENHIRSAGSIQAAAAAFTGRFPQLPYEIEVTSIEELEEVIALPNPPVAVLLDNMIPAQLKKCCDIIPPTILSEASGNFDESNVHMLVGTGINGVSLGALTKDPGHFDFSFLVDE